MSLFLSHIHFWLFNKIKIQDDLTREIVESLGDPGLKEDLDKNLGLLAKGDLEDLVDENNIHGSLQGFIDLVDTRLDKLLAYVVEEGLDLERVLEIAYDFGVRLKDKLEIEEGQDLKYYYILLNDIFLCGMPCSRANEVLNMDGESLEFRTNREIYKGKFIGGLERTYKDLKCSLGNGLLEGRSLELVNLEEDFYLLRRV